MHLPTLLSNTTGGRRWRRRISPSCLLSALRSSSRSATSFISARHMPSPTNRSATSSCSCGCCATASGGWAAVGFALQAAALGLGSVLLVQARMVTSLLFALPINALFTRRRVTRWEWTWAALLAAAVAVIVTVGNPTAGHSLASLETWTAVIAVLGPALVLCVVGARIWSGTVDAVLLAVVSGALWGVF